MAFKAGQIIAATTSHIQSANGDNKTIIIADVIALSMVSLLFAVSMALAQDEIKAK